MSAVPVKKATGDFSSSLLGAWLSTQKKATTDKNKAVAQASASVQQGKPSPNSSNIVDSFSKWINDTAKNVGNVINFGLNDVEDFGNDLFKGFTKFLNEQIEELGGAIGDLGSDILINIEDIGTALEGKVNDAKNFLDNSLEDIGSNLSMLPAFIGEVSKDAISSINQKVTNLGMTVADVVSDGLKTSSEVIGSAVSKAIDRTNRALEQVSSEFEDTLKRLQKNADSIMSSLADSFNDVALYTLEGFKGLGATIEKLFTFDAKTFVDLQESIVKESVDRQIGRIGTT